MVYVLMFGVPRKKMPQNRKRLNNAFSGCQQTYPCHNMPYCVAETFRIDAERTEHAQTQFFLMSMVFVDMM